MRRIFLTDVHLTPGNPSDISSEKVLYLADILDGKVFAFDELILTGDTFEPEFFGYWAKLIDGFPLYLLQKIIEVPTAIVAGNHDRIDRLLEVVPASKVHRAYLTSDGVLCLHGDIFDRAIARFPKASAAVSRTGIWLENYVWRGADEAFESLAKKLSKQGRFSENQNYIPHLEKLARWHKATAVVWGHTHSAHITQREHSLIANGGTWKGDRPASLIYQADDSFELYQFRGGKTLELVSRGRRPNGGSDG